MPPSSMVRDAGLMVTPALSSSVIFTTTLGTSAGSMSAYSLAPLTA